MEQTFLDGETTVDHEELHVDVISMSTDDKTFKSLSSSHGIDCFAEDATSVGKKILVANTVRTRSNSNLLDDDDVEMMSLNT